MWRCWVEPNSCGELRWLATAALPTWLGLLRISAAARSRWPQRARSRTPRIAHSSCAAEPCPSWGGRGASSQAFPVHCSGHVLPVLGAARKSGHLVRNGILGPECWTNGLLPLLVLQRRKLLLRSLLGLERGLPKLEGERKFLTSNVD